MFNFLTVSTLITVEQSDYFGVLKTVNTYSNCIWSLRNSKHWKIE